MINRIAFLAALLAVGSMAGASRGAQPELLRYRRILVPQDDLESQIRGLLPMKRSEFDARRQQASLTQSGSSHSARARVEQAEYTARLDAETLVDGKAALKVAVAGDGPQWLRLGPCNLALVDPRWNDDVTSPVVGQTPDGELAGLVEENGQLHLGWSLRGTPMPGKAVQFQLQLPPALSSVITLDLPAEQTLLATGGLVTGGDPAPGTSDRKLWRVDVGGHGRVLLTVQPAAAGKVAGSIIGVRETSTYSLYGSALDVQALLDLNLFEQRAEPVKLRIERPLELTTIRRGEEPLTWRLIARDESSMTVAVDDIAATSGTNVTIEVNATAPWSPDPPANLPRLTVLDGVYQEGLANVVAPNWLRMQARPLRGCWQSAVVPAAPGRNVDQLQFQLQEAAAAIEVATDFSQPRIRELSGTQITIDASYISAVTTSEMTVIGGERYQIEAQIPRRWLIDAVDVSPAEDVSDRSLTPGEATMQVLRLNLRTPLAATRRVRITIRARQRRPAGAQSLPSAYFRVATFSHVREAERLVAIRTVDPNVRLQLQGADGSLRLDPGTLPESQMKLFETPPGPVLFDDSQSTTAITAELTRAPVRYRADIRMETRVAAPMLDEAVSLRCLPDASAIGQVLVQLSPRPPGSVTWSIVGEDRRGIEVEPVASDAVADEMIYRVRLVNPRSEPFELRGEWTRTISSSADLVLASAPEASGQSGVVEIHAIDASPFDLVPDELQPQLVPSGSSEQWTTLRGRFLYEPGRQIRPRLMLIPAEQAPSAAVIALLALESRFDGRGNGEHELSLEIENQGLRQLKLRLPLTARDVRQFNARTGQTSPVARLSPELIAIDLPAGERRTTVHLRYRSEDAALGWRPVGRLTAPLVSTDVPVLARQWNVSVAPGLAFRAGQRSLASAAFPSRLSKQSAEAGESALTTVSLLPPATNSLDRSFQGWSRITTPLSADDAASIDVFQPDIVQGLALAALLGAAGIAFLLGRSAAFLLVAALLVLSLGLLQGPALSLVLQGVAAGLVLSGAARLFWPAVRQPALRALDAGSRVRTHAHSGALCLAGVGCGAALAATAFAQQAPLPEPRVPEERVVIPVDADQNPTGDYVYLSPRLYERLQAVADNAAADLPAWLITEVHYDLPGEARDSGGTASIDEILARFEVEVLRAPTSIELPLRRDQVVLLEGRAQLDGAPAPITWRRDGAALLVPIDTAGSHRLELAFGAPAKKSTSGALLELMIPTVSRATVGTRATTGPPPTILSAQGGALEDESATDRRVVLGPAGKLTVLWPTPGDLDAAARLEAEQLLWWTLRPGSVVVEGKFKFRPIGGAVQRVSIAVDPQLRLLPGSIRPAPTRSWIDEGSPAVLNVEFAESTAAEVTISASWLWIGASGTGNLLLPPVQAHADRLVRSWCGVSAEQPLGVTAEQGASGRVQPEDFLIAWNEPAAEPALVIDELASGARLQVTAQPAASQPTILHASDWSIYQGRAVLRYEAQQTQVPANRYQQRLELPPAVKVSRVEIVADGKPTPLRWDQRADGTLVVMHLAAPPREQVLRVEAEARLGNRDRWALPQPQIQDSATASRACRIYRQEDVLVQISSADGWLTDDALLVGDRSDDLGRLVAALRTDGAGSKPLTVELAGNRPAINGRMAVLVAEDDGAWSADADLALRISGGLLDAVRLEVPPEWSGPFEITPAVEHRIRAVPGSTAHELTIWPQQPADDVLHLSIRAPLRAADGQSVHAPSIRLLQAQSLERLVLLDARFGGDLLRWETAGLQPVSAPADAPAAWSSGEFESFRAVAERYEATPVALPRIKLKPHIELVETLAEVRPGQRVLNRTTFFVDPGGVSGFDVSLPAGSRLASLTVNGQTAICRAVGLRSWRVASPAPRVHLLLEVVYESAVTTSADDGDWRLHQAQIQGITPRRTVWRLVGMAPASRVEGQRVATGAEAEIARLEAAASALADVAGVPPGDLPAVSFAAAWRHWLSEFDTSDRRLQTVDWDFESHAPLKPRRDAALKRVGELTKKLTQAGVVLKGDLANEPDADPTQRSPGQRPEAVVIAQGSLEAQHSVDVKGPRPVVAIQWDWLYAATSVLAALAIGSLGRFAIVRRAWSTQPFFIIVLCGLAWWLIAPVSWAGWIAVAAGVWLSIHSPWVRRTGDASHFAHPRPIAG